VLDRVRRRADAQEQKGGENRTVKEFHDQISLDDQNP
jgi:hypothetical protein